MDNYDQLPIELFDWISERDFDQLEPREKELVLEFISREEYTELHESSRLMHRMAQDRPRGEQEVKKELMEAFAVHHQKTAKKSFWYQLVPMRYAASLMLALTGTFVIYTMLSAPQSEVATITIPVVDTVYEVIEKPVETVKHDTVYLTKRVQIRTPKKAPSIVSVPKPEPLPGQFYIYSPGDYQQSQNQKGDLPLNADSLVQRIGFVSL